MNLTKGLIAFVMDILETIVFVGSIFIVIYLYILQPNQVKGESMTNTFQDKDYIFTSKVTYKQRKPELGDVVVFHAPRKEGQDFDIEYIKRVIGVPGDTVSFVDCVQVSSGANECDVTVNGKLLNEPYIRSKTVLLYNTIYTENELIIVPEGSLFVMGDNRPGSQDSRAFGPISQESVIGVVFFRYLPLSHLGWITNPQKNPAH